MKTDALKQIVQAFILLEIILLVTFFPSSVNINENISSHYYFFFCSFIIGGILLIISLNLFYKLNSIIDYFLLFILIIVFFRIAVFPNQIYSLANEKLTYYLIFIQLYLLIRFFMEHQFIVKIYYIFTIILIIELLLIIYQLTLNYDINKNVNASLRGTFSNSGILACYLVCSLPTAISVIKVKIDNIKMRITLQVLTYIVVLIFLFIIKYRIAIIAFFIYTIHLIIKNKKNGQVLLRNVLHKVIFSLIVCCLIYLFFNLMIEKSNSTLGRMLMYKIVWQHFFDNFWFGFGFGKISIYYPQWQALYFNNSTLINSKDILLAGETYHPFNEYLIIFKEVGFVGITIFALCITKLFKKNKIRKCHTVPQITLILVGICSLTSYPLHCNIIILLSFYCLAIILYEKKSNKKIFFHKKKYLMPINLTIIICFISLIIIYGNETYSVFKWKKIKGESSILSYRQIKEIKELLPILRFNGKYLLDIGEILINQNINYLEGIEIVENSKKCYVTLKTYNLCGTAYSRINNHPKAIQNYIWVSNYIPNRFVPKFELLKSYLNYGDIVRAKKIAQIIITMPVKVPSLKIEEIKNHTYLLINNGFKR